MGYRTRIKSFLAFSSAFLAVFFLFTTVTAAPHSGEEFQLSQPDGSLVPVLVWGDEFYQDVESLDGFTLVRDADGWICYAQLSADGSEYVSTGGRYTGAQSRSAPGVSNKLRISRESMGEKHRRNREAVGYDNDAMIPENRGRSVSLADAAAGALPAPMEVQTMMGLTVLINFPAGTFPDTNATFAATTSAVTREAMEEFCNREGGFRGTNAAGSVRDWFLDVSNGTLDYSNIVAEPVTVTLPKQYYDRGTNYVYVPELLQSALNVIKSRAESGQLDLSGLSTEGNNNTVMALNVLYAGSPTQGWSNGIWPHQGTYRAPTGQSAVTINVGGRTIRFGRYQLASLGTGTNPPGIGTFVHENGHMIMRWPDLYNYDNTVTNVVAGYCVMSSSNGSNPQMPNPRFRFMSGWTTLVNITNFTDTVLSHPANSGLFAYQFRRNNRESYIIEARRRVGRSANIPGEGLIIWHIDTAGVNTRLNTSRPMPHVKVVRADVATSTTTAFPSGSPGANAPFRAGGGSRVTTFNGTSSPPAQYYDGVVSPIRISEVSALGDEMTFRVGGSEGGPVTYYLMVDGGTGGGYYAAGANVTIRAPQVNTAGRGFYRWTSSNTTATPANASACTTTVTMPAAELTLTANFVRLWRLPGAVEADTFATGSATGIASASNTNGATGNRVGRITQANATAEYLVNVDTSGQYTLTYRVLQNNSSNATFRIVDVTNNVILDTATITSRSATAMITLTGKTVNLPAGRAVWRFESLTMSGTNYNVDWFAASLESATPVTMTARPAMQSYDIKTISGKVIFHIPTAEHVSVKMYDMRGRTVATLSDGMKTPGTHSINISKAGLGQGLYIVRMKSGSGYSKDVKVHYRR